MIRVLPTALLLLSSTGCFIHSDYFPEECDAARCGAEPQPDAEPEPEPEPAPYQYVHIVDNTVDRGGQGVDGADICGLVAVCDDQVHVAVDATLYLGDGEICDGTTNEAPCEAGVNRQNPLAALDDGYTCLPHFENEFEPSHAVSLGLAGELAVRFDVDLRGCLIDIGEHLGRDAEPYLVYVCNGPTLTAEGCLGDGDALAYSHAEGGQVSFDVPEE